MVAECSSSGGPTVLVDVERGAEVRAAQSLDDGHELGVLVDGLGDLVAGDHEGRLVSSWHEGLMNGKFVCANGCRCRQRGRDEVLRTLS